PVVAVGLVLSAVFVPCAFIGGITGLFYRQFALTIAVSTLISAFNSLTLSPALSALLLKPQKKGGIQQPLPRLSFVIIGGWLGYVYAGPWLAGWLAVLVEQLPPEWAGHLLALPDWAPLAAGVTACVVAGWVLGRPLNWVLGFFFWLFNLGFNASTGLYARVV